MRSSRRSSRKKSIRRHRGGDRDAVLQRILRAVPSLLGLSSTIATSLEIVSRTPEVFDRWFSNASHVFLEAGFSRADLASLNLDDKKTILLAAMQQHRFPQLVPIFSAMTPVPRSTQPMTPANNAWYQRIIDEREALGYPAQPPALMHLPAAVQPASAWSPPNRSMSNAKHIVDCKPLIDQLKDLLTDPISQTVIEDPVIADDGHLYDRRGLETWLRNNDTSPLTRQKMSNRLMPFVELRSIITYAKPYLEHLDEMSGGKLSKKSKKSGRKRD